MKIDDLLELLLRARAEGNLDVRCGGFLGTNSGYTVLNLIPPSSKNIKNSLTGNGDLSLHVELANADEIKEGVKDMQSKGYDFYRSQYVAAGETPKKGLSPCEWHLPW